MPLKLSAIAVPTKALVRDKVTSPQYKDYNIQGISEEYPIGKRWLHLYDKLIVTYKSLPTLAEKVDISKYHLLVDEMHMLASMSGYAKATTLSKWYLIKRTTKDGVTCYRILQRLTDTLVN